MTQTDPMVWKGEIVCNPNSRYKNKNYYLRHIKQTLPPVVYTDLDTALKEAGL